jgi:hypothetical protein
MVFYVPVKMSEKVKNAVFETGAGALGNYSHCSFEVRGTGQFKPLKGSNPTIGEQDKIELVEELRVEILCDSNNIQSAVNALKEAHPYEEPAYEIYKIEQF